MLEYLLKLSACLFVLLLFYRLLLEKENMHIFKRFYLLGAVILSFVIPTIVLTEFIQPLELVGNSGAIDLIGISNNPTFTTIPTDIDVFNFPLLAWTIYAIGTTIFGFRFLKNITQILLRIRKNQKIKAGSAIRVLLNTNLPPHTFFKYVFLNKTKFESNEIPKEVLLHEDTHAKQLHSLDVLFVELLQVVLWFNPLIYWLNNAIKLNHEFLADSVVLKKEASPENYQNTLFSYLSQGGLGKYQSVMMVNAINYSLIKKRFTIMKTRTSKKRIFIRAVLLLPLAMVLLYGFSDREIIEKETLVALENTINAQNGASREQMKEYDALAKKYNEMPRNKMYIKMREVERLHYIYGLMSDKQRKNAEPFPDFPEPPQPPKAPASEGIGEIPPPSPPLKADDIGDVPPSSSTKIPGGTYQGSCPKRSSILF